MIIIIACSNSGVEGFEKSEGENFNATGDRPGAYYINHGNQPNMQAAWLFNYSGKPRLTQKWTREIMDRYYGSTPLHGWLGDEDEGQIIDCMRSGTVKMVLVL